MKKSILFFSFALISAMMFAQTIVSTTPQNKNVLIEEFTGVNCGYCPDGHKIAHNIMEANPGRAFMIALHQGSYANTTPDYRTSFGDAIAGQTGLTGYPAGTVNRHVFAGAGMTSGGTGMGRGSWASSATTIIGQSSPVNIAIDVDLNYSTREISILCEVYYTANEANSTNKLNVAILQNFVKGPQSGSSYNPDFVTSDGQYMHMHMLRHLITGQWGITIPSTTTGTFFDTTFTYTIPASYGAINVDLNNIEVVAFVSQGNQEVLTATGETVMPLDASISNISDVSIMSCTNSITPKVTLVNKGTSTLTKCDIKYSIDGGTENTYAWTGSLAKNANAEITLPTISSISSGSHVLKVHTSSPNDLTDLNIFNDSKQKVFAIVSTTNINTPVTQNFSATTFPPNDFMNLDFDGDGLAWTRTAAGNSSAGSAIIKFYDITAGNRDDLIINPIDLSGKTNSALSFYVAHRQYNTSYSDKLQVDVSTDCGVTWTTKWNKSGATLATGAAMSSGAFTTPTAAEWRFESVDLSAYDGMNDVLVRFRATSAYGNNALIDDINISQNAGIEDAIVSSFSVYPNPATDAVNVSFNSAHSSDALISIYNIDGSLVYQSSNFVTHGNNLISVPVSNLDNGFYTARINVEGEMIQDRFVVVK